MHNYPSKKQASTDCWSPFALVSFVAIMRLIPHPANFTPLFALTLFTARYSQNLFWAIVIPQGALLASNIFLGFSKSALVTALFNLCISIGARHTLCKNQSRQLFWLTGSIFVPVLFFFVSNFFVWIDSSFFSKNIEGLISCYTYAIPFALAPITSTVVYSIFFFELPALVALILLRYKSEGDRLVR